MAIKAINAETLYVSIRPIQSPICPTNKDVKEAEIKLIVIKMLLVKD